MHLHTFTSRTVTPSHLQYPRARGICCLNSDAIRLMSGEAADPASTLSTPPRDAGGQASENIQCSIDVDNCRSLFPATRLRCFFEATVRRWWLVSSVERSLAGQATTLNPPQSGRLRRELSGIGIKTCHKCEGWI